MNNTSKSSKGLRDMLAISR